MQLFTCSLVDYNPVRYLNIFRKTSKCLGVAVTPNVKSVFLFVIAFLTVMDGSFRIHTTATTQLSNVVDPDPDWTQKNRKQIKNFIF
jgi:hypothetical protein